MCGANSSTIVIEPLVAYAAKADCTSPVLKPSMNWRTGAPGSSLPAGAAAGTQRISASHTTNACFMQKFLSRKSVRWQQIYMLALERQSNFCVHSRLRAVVQTNLSFGPDALHRLKMQELTVWCVT